MAKELDKVYDPKQVEDRVYAFWQDKKYFHADAHSKKRLIPSSSRPLISRGSCIWVTRWTIPSRTR